MKNNTQKKYNTIGCCGIDCGLCPRYYTEGTSQCPGCFGPKFIEIMGQTCSFITCCIKKQEKEACGECNLFPCPKFDSKWFGENAYDSFVTHKRALSNMQDINKYGLKPFIKQQQKRIKILERMLNKYNDGRSKNLYCLATALLTIKGLENALKELNEKALDLKIDKNDKKNLAKLLRTILLEIAANENQELKLNKPPTWKK
jgi:hypothetical protein